MNACPLQGNSSRGFVPYNEFYEIDEMRGLAVGILDRYAKFPCNDIKKIVYFVNKYYRYKTDFQMFGLIDYWQFPTEVETSGFADCDCSSFFVASLLESIGVDTRVCIGASPYGYHAWCECVNPVDGSWLLIETTNGKIYPWEYRQKMGYKPDLYVNPVGCATPGELNEVGTFQSALDEMR